MAPNLVQCLLLTAVFGRTFGGPSVTDVQPQRIGFMGGTITITGTGFSEDVFNQFDPVLGNKVWFANEFVSVSCQNPINWSFLLENPQDPSTTKIVCDLPARLGKKGSNWFNLQLKVDGEEVQNSKAIEYRTDYTPEIRQIVPRYGKPGDLMTIRGRIFTKEYGNSNFGDSGSVEARREESITALMLGTSPCELTDELGNVYNMQLDSTDSDYGTIACKPAGSFIGPVNATLYVSGKYGKSKVNGAYSVNSKGQLFVYHTLPEITSISPNTGGSMGGTHVTIKGNSFDAFGDKTKVKIGSTACEIFSINNNELICSTPPEDSCQELVLVQEVFFTNFGKKLKETLPTHLL
eukprot:TRINITY_DN12661_c0_g1_i1.p1 TRINITY_DN12661_c0_g1~~TRINITY_DN12661_c0_g1_i1.p1  ORF type:complete len:350 (-),score=80.50 TRINITY_DN12661_c0_g1_i1:331-1380(-)